MPAISPDEAHHRASYSANRRWGNGEAADEARAALFEAKIKRLVDNAPPLTKDQRRRLAAIIRGGAE